MAGNAGPSYDADDEIGSQQIALRVARYVKALSLKTAQLQHHDDCQLAPPLPQQLPPQQLQQQFEQQRHHHQLPQIMTSTGDVPMDGGSMMKRKRRRRRNLAALLPVGTSPTVSSEPYCPICAHSDSWGHAHPLPPLKRVAMADRAGGSSTHDCSEYLEEPACCPHAHAGCNFTGTRMELPAHLEQCRHEMRVQSGSATAASGTVADNPLDVMEAEGGRKGARAVRKVWLGGQKDARMRQSSTNDKIVMMTAVVQLPPGHEHMIEGSSTSQFRQVVDAVADQLKIDPSLLRITLDAPAEDGGQLISLDSTPAQLDLMDGVSMHVCAVSSYEAPATPTSLSTEMVSPHVGQVRPRSDMGAEWQADLPSMPSSIATVETSSKLGSPDNASRSLAGKGPRRSPSPHA
eukprot:jgi/Chlat1/2771/Chrsp187S02910